MNKEIRPSINFSENLANSEPTTDFSREVDLPISIDSYDYDGGFPASVSLKSSVNLEATSDSTVFKSDASAGGAGFEVSKAYVEPWSIPGRDFARFDTAVRGLKMIRQKNDPNLLKGAIHNALAELDNSLDSMSYDMALSVFFGRPDVKDEEAADWLENVYSLVENTDQLGLRDFLALPEEEQKKKVLDYAQEHFDSKPKMRAMRATATGGVGFGLQQVPIYDNPDFDYNAARENYLEMLSKNDLFSRFQYARTKFSRETMFDAMAFIRADNWRSDTADAYVEKLLAGNDKQKAIDFVQAVNIIAPEKIAGFWDRVGIRLGERATDSWVDAKQWFSDDVYSVNPDTVYSWAKDFGAFEEDGSVNEKNFAKLRSKVEEYGKSSFGIWALDEEYSDSQIEQMYKEGRERFEKRALFRQLRALSATSFDYSNVGGTSKLLEDTAVVGFEMLKYVGAGAAGTFFSGGNPLVGIAASSALMYVEETSRMYNELVYDGNMPLEKAAYYSTLYGATSAALERIQVIRFSKTSRGISYLMKGSSATKTFREWMKFDFKELPRTYLREGGAENFTEFAQNIADYATKKWVASHENATFDERELWNNFASDFVDTAKVMPTLMAFATIFGFGVNANRRRRQAGGSFKSFFSPSETLDNQVRTMSALQQLDKLEGDMSSFGGDMATRYNEDFLSQYIKADSAGREQLINERFTDAAAREKFLDDFAILDDKMLAFEKLTNEAARQIAIQSAELQRRNSEEAKQLESDYQKLPEFSEEADKLKPVRDFLQRFGGGEDVVFVDSVEDLPAGLRLRSE